MSYIVTKRLRIEGFIVIDHFDKFPAFLAEVGPWVRDGKVAYRETVVDGLERAPEALLGLLSGENIGKMLVKIGPDA
jgi:NADPH-dependent curcumin reductase CurA